MESMEIEIHVRLTEEQARELAQFLKRVYYSDYRQHATSEAAAYRKNSRLGFCPNRRPRAAGFFSNQVADLPGKSALRR